MLMPDVNILVYAHRADERTHPAYREWLERRLAAPEPVALSVLAAVGFLRIVTNRRIYSDPTPLSTAVAAVDAIANHPNCRHVGTTTDHLARVSELCVAAGATGKLVADAHHAAVAMSSGACWVSRDADFRRFEPHGLRWQHLVLT